MNEAADESGLPDGDPARDRGMRTLLRYLPFLALGNLMVAVPALLLSLTVAYFTFVQAAATERMQQAAVWPYVTYATSNLDEDGRASIALSLVNKGAGPARIEAMEIRYRGEAVGDARDLLARCCAADADTLDILVGGVVDDVLSPGEEKLFLGLVPDATNGAVFERLSEARLMIEVNTCYCSVFDECSVTAAGSPRPRAVERCPADWTRFGMSR